VELEILRATRDVEQLQMLEQMFVHTAYDNAARQRLVQIRERLERARQKLQLLDSLRESADRLEVLDFRFLLRNLL
jgi:ribosome-interacting GTPase 1